MRVEHYRTKLKTYLYSAAKGMMRSRRAKANNTVVICFFGSLGDAVMFLDALSSFVALQQSRGGKLVLACRKSVINLFKEAGFESGIVYEEIDKELFDTDFHAFRDYVKALSKYDAEYLFHVRASYVVEDVFIHAIRANRKVSVRGKDVDGKGVAHIQYFVNHTYDDIFNTDESEDQLTHYGTILKRFGMPEYKSRVFRLSTKPVPFGLDKGDYILVCPGASSEKKAWPPEKFAETINFLLQKYSDPIILSGDEKGKAAGELIESMIADHSRVVNLIGKSNLQEWLALIKNAGLVLANESGAVHVAAASRVPCVCIGAQEFGESFLPYRPEVIQEDDCLPVVVRCAKLDCFYCKTRERYIDGSGKICYIPTGTFPCLNKIEVAQVTDAIEAILE